MSSENKDVTQIPKDKQVETRLLVKAYFITSEAPEKIQEGSFSIKNIGELGKVIDFLATKVKIIRLNKFEFETEVVLWWKLI